MPDRTSTQTYFVAGLLAAVVLVPVLAVSGQNRAHTTHDTPQTREET